MRWWVLLDCGLDSRPEHRRTVRRERDGLGMTDGITAIHEDNHLLVVDKPAGLLVQGDRSGDETLLERAREYIRRRYDKPGNVYLGLVHRLDRNVSGVVVLARTSKAAARLSEQFRKGTPGKFYLAVVEGKPPADRQELKAYLTVQGDAHGVTRAELTPFEGARESVLNYEVLDRNRGASLLRVQPRTGRRHQIRAQLALIGCPLRGDVKYGAARGLPDHRIGLHAERLALAHPIGAVPIEFTAPVPGDWPWLEKRGS